MLIMLHLQRRLAPVGAVSSEKNLVERMSSCESEPVSRHDLKTDTDSMPDSSKRISVHVPSGKPPAS